MLTQKTKNTKTNTIDTNPNTNPTTNPNTNHKIDGTMGFHFD